MFIILIYVLGSIICATAQSGGVLIGGRVVQGLGSGGVVVIVPVIVSDLVPLRQRGYYMAMILIIFAMGTSLGPFIGGVIVQATTWRWVFYINVPIGGTALIILFLVLHTSHADRYTVIQRIKRLDILGAFILTMTSLSILFALTYGGVRYKWSSGYIIGPLILGLCGFILYFLYENSRFCVQPMTPLRLFRTRTAVVVVINTFIASCLLIWVIFYLPPYFQAILGSTPVRAGVQLLPCVLVAILGSAAAGLILGKTGRYKPLHLVGWGFTTLGLGLFSLLGPTSSTAEWVIFQLISAIGSGMIYDSLLPALQATISEKDQAAGTATLAFLRCFSNTWGYAIPTLVFNTQVEKGLGAIVDIDVRNSLAGGRAYEHATLEFMYSLSPGTKHEVIQLFTSALQMIWWVAAAMAGVSFLLTFLEEDLPLREELETEYWL
jgi:MFS family permease